MNAKQWTALLFFYALYLLMGAYVFRYFETENERINVQKLLRLQSTLSFIVEHINDTENKDILIGTVQDLESQLGKNIFLPTNYKELIKSHVESTHYQTYNLPRNQTLVHNLRYIESIGNKRNGTENGDYDTDDQDGDTQRLLEKLWTPEFLGNSLFEEEGMWTMWNAFFFAFTALSTIGYGHMSPRTAGGQCFCIFFSLIGVPLNGILFAGLEGLFSSKIIRKIDNKRYESKWMLLFDSLQYMVPGLILFMLLPAVIFMSVEHWTYLESFYFAFITLTTIGFGDMVAGYSDAVGGDYQWLYRIGIQLWIIFGLGYFLMVITFIQKVLRSKEIRIFERKIRHKFKKKANLINDNLLKDLIKMREVVETISILKKKSNMEQVESDKRSSIVSLDKNGITSITPSKTNSMENVFEESTSDTDQDSLDIFMEIAETILHRSNDTVRSISELGQDNYGYMSDQKSEEPPRKPSILRKLSTWSTHTIPSILRINSHRDDHSEDNQDTITSDSPEIVDSLGELIGRIEDVILKEPICEINKRGRAFSLATGSEINGLYNQSTPPIGSPRKYSLHSNYARSGIPLGNLYANTKK